MTQTAKYMGPMAGLKVVDFGWYYTGPMVGMMMADQGADVVRVAKPGGAELPEQQYRLLNRNKKLVELDLKTDEGQAAVKKLIQSADILIENFRPGVMKRLGLAYEDVKASNPRLIYLSLPGFASTDEKNANVQAWQGIMDAAAGTYNHISMSRAGLNYPPVYTAAPHSAVYSAIHGSIAVGAALVAREKHGVGTLIEAPQTECGRAGFIWSQVEGSPSMAKLGNASAYEGLESKEGDSPQTLLEKIDKGGWVSRDEFGGAFGNYFRCADGKMFYLWVLFYPDMCERYLSVLGLYKQVLKEGMINEGPQVTGMSNNISNPNELDPKLHERLKTLIAEKFLTKTSEEWDVLFKKACIPSSIFRTRSEWLKLEPMLESGVLTKLDNGQSEITVPGRLADINNGDGLPSEQKYRDAEHVGRADIETLWGVAASKPTTSGPVLKKGDLLKGVKVLDLNSVLAGPTSGYVLAQYGAEVIKADSAGFKDPYGIMIALIEQNQGKRSIVTDVKTALGREVLEGLIRWADVVVHNILDDTAKRLGVAHDQLKAINPDIVSIQMSAFGGTHRGGWEARPGFDPIIQSATGLPAQYGTYENPHKHHMALSADTMGGFSLAYAAMLALYHKRRTGESVEGRTSLARANSHYQLPWMIMENDNCDWGEPRGQLALGPSWHDRMYECSDGWLYVATPAVDAPKLVQAVLGAEVGTAAELEGAFAKDSADDWCEKLSASGIACHKVWDTSQMHKSADIEDVGNEAMDAYATGAYSLFRRKDHPCGVPVITKAADHIRIGEDRSYWRPITAPRWGGHTTEILAELGYDDATIQDLIDLKVSWEYMPAIGTTDRYFFAPEEA